MSGVTPTPTLTWKAWGVVNLDGPPPSRPLRRNDPTSAPVLVADMLDRPMEAVGPGDARRYLAPRVFLSRVEAQAERDRMADGWPACRYAVVEFTGTLAVP